MLWRPSEESALRRRKCSTVSNANRTKWRWPDTRLLASSEQGSWVMGELGQPSIDGVVTAEAQLGYCKGAWKTGMGAEGKTDPTECLS